MSREVEYGHQARSHEMPPALDPDATARRRVLIALEDILQFDTDRDFKRRARARYLALTGPQPANDDGAEMQHIGEAAAAVLKCASIVMVHENINVPDLER